MNPRYATFALLLPLAFACSSSESSTPQPNTTDSGGTQDVVQTTEAGAEAAQEAAAETAVDTSAESNLPTCPNEKDLRDVDLPCSCYGHEANATTIVFEGCKTQVVCCPAIENLRCEDHEYLDDAGNWKDGLAPVDEAGNPLDAFAPCPDEVDLSTVTLPCDCYGTLVPDVKKVMPECTGIVKCCPNDHNLKCE